MVLFTPDYLCKPGKKSACLREGDYEAGYAITHVHWQTHVQSTVAIAGNYETITYSGVAIEWL